MALTLTYQQTEQKLRRFCTENFSADDVPYIILEAFGKHEADTRRYRQGRGTVASFHQGLLIKNLLAYCATDAWLMDSTLEALKTDCVVRRATPKIIAVSDGERILAYDMREHETYEQPLNKLYINFQFFYPLAGVERYRATDENPADVKAAEKMAKLHDEIRAYNDFSSTDDLHDLNIFMSRLLFCCFAEDTAIFEKALFTSSVERYTQKDGSDIVPYIEQAFKVMDQRMQDRKDLPEIISQFPYVNGSLFSKKIAIPRMGRKARQLLIECGQLDWKDINPDIFGSMIQAVVSPSERGSLGMHYTSVPNIMKVIQPFFLNDLYAAYAEAKDSEKKLDLLLVRMSKMKFFDPACGSGNFLIIAYKELRKLEIQIWQRLRELASGFARIPYVNINIDQFYGIEIDDFACEIAELSLRLAEHQMNQAFTRAFSNVQIPALPLKKMEHIAHGNACRTDWEKVCPHEPSDEVFLMGNPPYLGNKMQEDSHRQDMQHVFVRDIGELDYIACWFKLGADYIKNTKAKFAFVTTNSICQGQQVALLWKRILTENMQIFFAHTSFKWTNNAKHNAGVTCNIVGVEDSSFNKSQKLLFSKDKAVNATNISPYLIDARNIYIENRTTPLCNVPAIGIGNKPIDGGYYLFSQEEKDEFLLQEPQAEPYFHRWLGAEEFINGKIRYCLWLGDCSKEELQKLPYCSQRIEQVKEYRLNSPSQGTNHLASAPTRFHVENMPDSDYLLIPSTSSENRKYVPIGFIKPEVLSSNAVLIVRDADIALFGLLTSSMHMLWMRTIGGKLKTDYRYSAKIVYNNFPFPRLTQTQRKEIEQAAENVLLTREDYPSMTLAELYNPDTMPAPLREAHEALDLLVEQCYSTKPFESDEQRLECLFKLYEKLTNNR